MISETKGNKDYLKKVRDFEGKTEKQKYTFFIYKKGKRKKTQMSETNGNKDSSKTHEGFGEKPTKNTTESEKLARETTLIICT